MTKYERRELSHNWDEIRPLLKDSAQITYEIIRPILLLGVSPKERAEETDMSKSSIYSKVNLFDVSGMTSLLPPMPPSGISKQDKRALPPPIRQAIVDAHVEYSELSLHVIASICYIQFGRKPSPHMIQSILATGPPPTRTTRRYKRFAQLPLWPPGEVEWHVIIRIESPGRKRKRRGSIFVIQPPLPIESTGTQ